MTIAPLMIDIAGMELLPEEREILQHPLVGGVILFTRNYEAPLQVAKLIKTIRHARKTPILIAVDQEGGRVQRFKEPLTILPPASYFGELYRQSIDLALTRAEKFGYKMASELRTLGVDFSFAPVLDLDWQNSEVIGTRAFHRDPDAVILLAGAFMRGMVQAEMLTVGKHFPGHGWVKADSHTEIPVDTRDWKTLWNYDIRPFKSLISYGLHAIMPAHVIYSTCDAKPAGFSEFWLKKILRQQLGFKGIVYSDDLSMAGASVIGNMVDRVRSALIAGCDRVLICNQPESVVQVLDEPHLLC
jgi:beta-N-acetylhexosaminidase